MNIPDLILYAGAPICIGVILPYLLFRIIRDAVCAGILKAQSVISPEPERTIYDEDEMD
jgi:hypothetical protein